MNNSNHYRESDDLAAYTPPAARADEGVTYQNYSNGYGTGRPHAPTARSEYRDHGGRPTRAARKAAGKPKRKRGGCGCATAVAVLLALAVAGELGIPARQTLDKFRDNQPNSQLKTQPERRANVLGVYKAVDPEAFRGKRVLLLDDIVTTGATAGEAARVLLTAGACEVHCAAVAASRK